MNQDTVRGKWKAMRRRVREWWGKVTDDKSARAGRKLYELAGLHRLETVYVDTNHTNPHVALHRRLGRGPV